MKIHRKGKGFSFMIISRLNFKKNFGSKKKENSSSGEQKGVQTLQRPWPLQLYLSQFSSQVPLDNNVHNTEENFEKNTSIEDAFSNSEGIYTEIDPTCCSISEQIGASLSFSNPHSEMDDSLGQSNESSGIENGGYVPSEIDKIYRSTKVVPDPPFSISHYCSFPKENKEKAKATSSTVESHLGQSALPLDEFAPTINCNEIALQPLHFLSRSEIPKSNNVYCFNKNVNPNPFRSNQSYLSNRIPQTDECEGSSSCSSVSTFKIPLASSETFESVSDKNQAVLLKSENKEGSEYIMKRPLPALPECLNSLRNDNRLDS